MQLTSLGKVSDRLRAELSDFTKAFNARLTYFANLQQISDEVADPDMDSKQWRGLLIEIETLRQEERECPLFSSTTDISLTDLPPVPAVEQKAAIESKQSRRRYLDNLNSPAEREEAETTCPICSEHFTAGILTNCGHLTCAACFRKWHSVSKNCALCKQTLGAGSYTNVSVRAPLKSSARENESALTVSGFAVPQKGYPATVGGRSTSEVHRLARYRARVRRAGAAAVRDG